MSDQYIQFSTKVVQLIVNTLILLIENNTIKKNNCVYAFAAQVCTFNFKFSIVPSTCSILCIFFFFSQPNK